MLKISTEDYVNKDLDAGITTLPTITGARGSWGSSSKVTSSLCAPGSGRQQHHERFLGSMTVAVDISFAATRFSTMSLHGILPGFRQSHQAASLLLLRELTELAYMHMLVPLHSQEVATCTCSRTDTFKCVPMHVSEPAWDQNISPYDYVLQSPQLRDINDPSVPDHVRKGVAYEKGEYDLCFLTCLPGFLYCRLTWSSSKVAITRGLFLALAFIPCSRSAEERICSPGRTLINCKWMQWILFFQPHVLCIQYLQYKISSLWVLIYNLLSSFTKTKLLSYCFFHRKKVQFQG